MQFSRMVSVALALALGGCGSIGAIGIPATGGAPPPQPIETGGLPPTFDPGAPQTGGDVVAEPLADDPSMPIAGTPPPPGPVVAGGALGRTDLLGGWTISASGDSCQLFMTLTSWTGGYRASTRGCNNDILKSISAWNLEGKQVILAGTGGTPVARLQSSGNNRFDGQTEGQGATAVTFFR